MAFGTGAWLGATKEACATEANTTVSLLVGGDGSGVGDGSTVDGVGEDAGSANESRSDEGAGVGSESSGVKLSDGSPTVLASNASVVSLLSMGAGIIVRRPLRRSERTSVQACQREGEPMAAP